MTLRGMRSNRRAFAHPIPDHMDTAILPDSQLSAANGPHSHCRVRLSIDLDRFRELRLSGPTAHVEDVPAPRFALEIDQVKDSFRVNRRLWLDAVVRRANQMHLRRCVRRASCRDNK